MSFHADVYGYIIVKDSESISTALIEEIPLTAPIFKPCFSDAIKEHNTQYISFACRVKIDAGEDSLWLLPFESLLRKSNFLNATVHIQHEETSTMMMYSYFKNKGIQKISNKLTEQCFEDITLPD